MDAKKLAKALRDTAQSASNAIASNVSGPVDLISAGLRYAGLPIPNAPMGGSEWMAQKGLTSEVQMGAPRIIGETLGMAGPVVAAAKAPQIASGLIQMGKNAMTPSTINKQTGAIVWHGSPHKFDKFDSSKIGTGEGAQAYGHGLYLAESQDVAKGYRTKLNDSTIASVKADRYDIAGDPNWIVKAFDDAGDLIPKVSGYLAPEEIAKYYGDEVADMVLKSEYGGHFKNLNIQDGALYQVDLPDDQIAKMLDWDKPLSQQPQGAQAALAKLDPDMYHPNGGDYDPTELGQMIYQRLAQKGQDAAATSMRGAGIPGIRYLDGGSRGAGQGSSNFVVFPGNESLLQILERNGAPLAK